MLFAFRYTPCLVLPAVWPGIPVFTSKSVCCLVRYSWTLAKQNLLVLVLERMSMWHESGEVASLINTTMHLPHIPGPTMRYSERCIVEYGTSAFLFWMVYCGMWDKCNFGFRNLLEQRSITNEACRIGVHWPLLLTWFNFNPSMDK